MHEKLLLQFAKAINRKDLVAMNAMLHSRHLLIDALGSELHGREVVLRAWQQYFNTYPDYTIELTDFFKKENAIAAFGYNGAAYKNSLGSIKRWRLPAAWKIYLQDEQIKVWQVFTDTNTPKAPQPIRSSP